MRTIYIIPALIVATLSSSAFAQSTHYTDVPAGAYYEDAAAALLLSGALDRNETRLRPAEPATRAEVMKLLVNVYGSTISMPAQSSFRDVPRSAWYFPYMETAAREGWLRGDNACYGTNPARCSARPADLVNRAEMAIILQRAFRLPLLSLAPIFPDNGDTGIWYYTPLQVAADHCILQGDDFTGLVRPAANMNRGEMIVMFHRAEQQLRYGQDCAQPEGRILGISTQSARRIQVTFNLDLDPNMIGRTDRYVVEDLTRGTGIGITSITVANARTVQLSLASSLQTGRTYRLRVNNMRTENGSVFSDMRSFTSAEAQTPAIEDVTARTTTTVRIRFTDEFDVVRAQDENRYIIDRVGVSGTAVISSATLIDARTVDLTVASNLSSNIAYRVQVNDMRTDDGRIFSDSRTFLSLVTTNHITSAAALSQSKVRVTFDTDIDSAMATDLSRYDLRRLDAAGTIVLQSATRISSRIVDLNLTTNLLTGATYEVSVSNMRTTGGVTFSSSATFNYPSTVGHIIELTAISSTRLRLTFDRDLDNLRAEQSVRYNVSDGDSTLSVRTANLLGDLRTVELTLSETMQTQTAYTVSVIDLQTSAGVAFSDSKSVTYDAGSVRFSAMLRGTQEVPPVVTNASGTGTFMLTGTGLQYTITVQNLSSAMTAAHFHRGASGISGQAVMSITFNNNVSSGTWALSTEDRNALLDGEMYVNVHTVNHLDGEIRGQLLVLP